MKLVFSDPFSDESVAYQKQAIEAVCDLFAGQEICDSVFTVLAPSSDPQSMLGIIEGEKGVGNRLRLLDDELLGNLQKVQLRNGLAPSESLASKDFTVEMETGTGKTYVYLRTILELNKRYGFKKFVIVVPSVAIKEGVYKTLQITEDHFRTIYAGVPVDFFLYDSSKLGQVRNFATSATIQIMVVTVGAINKKDVNNLYKQNEKTGDYAPIELIRETHPIVIVDEPQSVDGGLEGQGKKALDEMKPLCTLRYSATHATKHHMVYRLDAVDAYERKLVKQIEVAAATIEGAGNKPYVRLIETKSTRGRVTATVEIDVEQSGGVQRKEVQVQDGDNLDDTTHREIYRGLRVGTITAGRGKQSMELRFHGGEQLLKPGEAHGDVDPLLVQRQMIRRTIKEHLDKEKRLRPQGIKVLSLFFIEAVDRYRKYDADGKPVKGVYAEIFEEEYARLARHEDYVTLFKEVDLTRTAAEVHGGYFAIDKKGGWTDIRDEDEKPNQTERDAAERAYSLIMREKEQLLSLDEPLKFIFSHSALKEGWDNPNVFQICTLRDIRTERERRQTIGRGLRLCVNQKGERQRGFDINTLTVVAVEDYETFAENLQKEIVESTGIRFGFVEPHEFARVLGVGDDGKPSPLGFEKSKELHEYLRGAGLIDPKGKVLDTLRTALRDEALVLPAAFTPLKDQIVPILAKLAGKLEVKNADERRVVPRNRVVLDSPEFRALWDRIKQRTTYRVDFDNEALIAECIKAVNDLPPMVKTFVQWRTGRVTVDRGGVAASAAGGEATVTLQETDIPLPDILTELQNRTQLTRRSIYRILTGSKRLADFRVNPQQFIHDVAQGINTCKQLAIVDGIKYERLGASDIWGQELFDSEELASYMKKVEASTKSPYEVVEYQSDTEAAFVRQLEANGDVKVYAKLPNWFRVPTPLGDYIPDWAVLVNTPDGERLYLVVETKGSAFLTDLRDKERAKIRCGERHFEAIATDPNPARYRRGTSLPTVLAAADTPS
jgi:type III restriction enzyme